jgi:divalent metal cation (Fe/Co/Zn/Cd) transporter
MKVLKKISGLFLIFIAGLLLIVSFGTLIEAIINVIKTHKDLKYFICLVILVFLITSIMIYIIKLGLKLIKSKVIPEDSIDDIGS